MAGKVASPAPRTRGRPKRFDRDAALQRAMTLFWERGYEGTTFDELIASMQISPSSFYNAFGSKEQLFKEAASAYVAQSGAAFVAELNAPGDTRAAFERLLREGAQSFTACNHPTGCMISLACTQVPPELTPLAEEMAHYRQVALELMTARIQRGIDAGDVPAGTDPGALAGFYGALWRGMVVLARDGATAEQLTRIVELGMRAWPAAPAGEDRSPG